MEYTNIYEDDFENMDVRKRAAFVNSLTGFKSASLIGTINKKEATNLAIFSSVIHLGSHPALIGFINRPHSTERHTLENILQTNVFTVNHVHEGIFKQAHQTSARYPKEISEFDSTGLTPEFSKSLIAPYVKESHIKYGVKFIEKHELKVNGTILVIGKIIEVILPKSLKMEDGSIDMEKAGTLAISGLDGYHTTKQISKLSYAKVDQPLLDLI